jgi:hypothetical protein
VSAQPKLERVPQASGGKASIPLIGWIGGIVGGLILLVLLGALLSPVINPPLPTATPTITPTEAPTNTPAPLPDLQIGRVRIVPASPAPGQFFRVNITFTNLGGGSSGAFSWSWDASVQDPIQLNTETGEVDNIPPGSSKTVSFPFLFGWWGEYTTQINVDVDAEVVETDERNNRLPFPITLANLPFNIDFTLLPDNSIVEPPLTLGSDTFDNWNLDFSLAVPQTDPCFATPMELLEVTDPEEDILLAAQAGVCDQQPVSVRITRRFVSDAEVFILPSAVGEATVILFSDFAGTQEVGRSEGIALTPGQISQVSGIGGGIEIRRVDVSTPGQRVQITRLVLSPPPP